MTSHEFPTNGMVSEPNDTGKGLRDGRGASSGRMFRGAMRMKNEPEAEEYEFHVDSKNLPRIAIDATAIGLLTGLIGVGGGFLIVPALVFVTKLPMRLAIGTSLLVITMNALAAAGVLPAQIGFDPYPFGLLTLIVSLEAIFLSIFVLVSQNRQSERDRIRTDLDYQVNVKAHFRYFPSGLDRNDHFFQVAVQLYEFLRHPRAPMPAELRLQ